MAIIKLDSRVSGYRGPPARVLGLCDTEKGTIFVAKSEAFSAEGKTDAQTVVVTDSPGHVKNWHLAYDERRDMLDVVKSFFALQRAGTIKIKDQMLDPAGILEMRKIDERGSVWEFNSDATNNGHVATLLLAWAGTRAIRGQLLSDQAEVVSDEQLDEDDPSMPFSV